MELRKIINVVTLVVMISVNVFTPFSYAEVETGAVVDTENPTIIEEPANGIPTDNNSENNSTSGNVINIEEPVEPINPIEVIEPELPVEPVIESGNVVSMSGINNDIDDEHGTTELSGTNNIEDKNETLSGKFSEVEMVNNSTETNILSGLNLDKKEIETQEFVPTTSKYETIYITGTDGNIIQTNNQQWEDLEVFFPQNNGTIYHYTIMDRNLGAETSDISSAGSYGYYYQWGNNYGFTEDSIEQIYNSAINASSYGPNNYYASKIWRNVDYSWDSSYNKNLWGGLGDKYNYDGNGTKQDRQGPCPNGYYIPSTNDWRNIYSLWYNSLLNKQEREKIFGKDFLMPFAGMLDYDYETNEVSTRRAGYDANYHSSSPYGDDLLEEYFYYFSLLGDSFGKFWPQDHTYVSYGFPIRCFKSSTNDINITVDLKGGDNGFIGFTGNLSSGKIRTLGDPTKDNGIFLGWYDENNNKVEVGDNIPSSLYAKRECKEGYSESSEGKCTEIVEYSGHIIGDSEDNNSFKWNTITIGDYMIMDRNLGAKEAGTGQNSYGYYYQRGNNYGFLDATNLNKSSTRISRNDNYLSGYAGNTFIGGYSDYWENNEHYKGLWGGENDTSSNGYGLRLDILDKKRQGPCPEGWHVPSGGERADLIKTRANKNGASYGGNEGYYYLNSKQIEFSNYFKLPFAGQLQYSNYYVGNKGEKGKYRTSSPINNSYPDNSKMLLLSGTTIASTNYRSNRAYGLNVRCFRDTPLIKYNTNGGLIRGELEQEIKINQTKNLLKPRKKGHRDFKGWYTTSGFEQGTKIETEKITAIDHNDINLYAKWECENGYTHNGDICEGPETALLTIGEEFNRKIKTLAKGEEVTSSGSPDELIKHIKRSYEEEIPSGKRWTIISDEISDITIYARFDESDSTIYYKTEAEKIYMNDDSSGMFQNLKSLENLEIEDFDTSKVTNMAGLFNYCINLTNLDINNWDVSNVTSMGAMFQYNSSLETLDLNNWNVINVTSISQMFYGDSNLTSLNINKWDTSNIKNMNAVFYGCSKLSNLDIEKWDVTNVTTISSMFNGCSSITELDLSNWKLFRVTDMRSTFRDCTGLVKLNLGNQFNTVDVIDMGAMFYGDNNLIKLDLSGFSMSSLKNMDGMFAGCSKLEEINMSGWDFSKNYDKQSLIMYMTEGGKPSFKKLDMTNTKYGTTMIYAFGGLQNLEEIILDGVDTSSVTNMEAMFYGCNSLKELDLSNFDTSNVTNMKQMFQDADNLKTIYVSDKFTTGNVTSSLNMFSGTTSIVGGNGTTYDADHINTEYARIDTSEISGYFTNILDKPYKITYNSDNGIISGEVKTIYTQRDTFTLPIPTKQGYVFKGWIGSNGNNPQIEVKIEVGTKGNLEYTAIWEVEDSGNHYSGGGRKSTSDDKEHNAAVQEAETETIKIVDNQDNDNKDFNQIIDNESESDVTNNKDYSQEQKDAYSFAKSNGITTTSTIKDAKMNTNITRIEMAKMLSYYAINVLGKTPDTSKTIKFKDVSSKKDKQYDNGVTLAYQLGIMGQNVKNNKFRPNDEVTRAELVTSLSRMLYGTPEGTNKGTSKYYEPHMAKLYNEGIITNTDPNLKEKRGYLMTMLMRSTIK